MSIERQSNPQTGYGNLPRDAFWQRVESIYDFVFAARYQTSLKRIVIHLSVLGFVVHLLLIFLAHLFAVSPAIVSEVGGNYLNAISTPFNIILFYEVLTLISALPDSTTRSIANQYEIVSLIFIREVFRDIAQAGDLVNGHRVTRETLPLFMDMWAGVLMFLLVAVFRHIAQKRQRFGGGSSSSPGVARFVAQKKAISVGLALLLIAMALWNLGLLAVAIYNTIVNGHGDIQSATSFFNDLFTVMIFTDVLILILSLNASGQYELVFRNAAFIVSIILIRFALAEEFPFGAPLALVAMAFGTATLAVFHYHSRLNEAS
jgi:hypothetical protein